MNSPGPPEDGPGPLEGEARQGGAGHTPVHGRGRLSQKLSRPPPTSGTERTAGPGSWASVRQVKTVPIFPHGNGR